MKNNAGTLLIILTQNCITNLFIDCFDSVQIFCYRMSFRKFGLKPNQPNDHPWSRINNTFTKTGLHFKMARGLAFHITVLHPITPLQNKVEDIYKNQNTTTPKQTCNTSKHLKATLWSIHLGRPTSQQCTDINIRKHIATSIIESQITNKGNNKTCRWATQLTMENLKRNRNFSTHTHTHHLNMTNKPNHNNKDIHTHKQK